MNATDSKIQSKVVEATAPVSPMQQLVTRQQPSSGIAGLQTGAGNAALAAAASNGALGLSASLLPVQSTYGNAAASRSLQTQRTGVNQAASPPFDTGTSVQRQPPAKRDIMIQPKLTVGAAHDTYEQEADRVAQQVMRLSTPPSTSTGQASVQGQTPEKDETAQTKPLAATITSLAQRASSDSMGSFEPGADFESRLSTSGGGSPLPASTRAFMETRFGADFSGVQLHTGSEAAQLNRTIGAQAFTHGRDIYLGEGKNDLESSAGKQLLAHELTHTIQQGAAHTAAAPIARFDVVTGAGAVGRLQPSLGNITRSMSVLVQRSWISDRIDWVRTATHDDNWDKPNPPGAYYVLNGLSMDDMVRVLRALSPADRKKLSDNLDEHAGGFDRSRLQLALTNAAAPSADKAFRERSENLLWAIRSGNYANPPDGAFLLLATTKGAERDRLIAALNRDALDALIAHRDEADGVPGGAEAMSAINQKRGGVAPTGREQRLIDLIDGNAWKSFFTEFNVMNETDQLRFLSGNFGVVARIRNHIGSAEWGGDRDRMRYLLERATTTASTSLYVDASVPTYRWQPKYRVENTNEYSRFISFGDAFNVEIDINTIDDGELSEDGAEKQFQEAQPGPGGFLWPANRNRSTLPIMWQAKQDVRQQMKTLVFDEVLKAGIMVIQYLLDVVFPFAHGMAIRSLAALRRGSVFGRWMKGAQVIKGRKPPSLEAAFDATKVAEDLFAQTAEIAHPGMRMVRAGAQLSKMVGPTALQKVEVMLAFFKKIGFAISKEGVIDEGASLLMHSEDKLYAFRFVKATGEIRYGKFDLTAMEYVWKALE